MDLELMRKLDPHILDDDELEMLVREGPKARHREIVREKQSLELLARNVNGALWLGFLLATWAVVKVVGGDGPLTIGRDFRTAFVLAILVLLANWVYENVRRWRAEAKRLGAFQDVDAIARLRERDSDVAAYLDKLGALGRPATRAEVEMLTALVESRRRRAEAIRNAKEADDPELRKKLETYGLVKQSDGSRQD